MPSNEVHSKHTYQLFGERASDLHRWMDEPWKSYGRSHRELRHDPNDPPKWAVKKYGLLLTKTIMQDHVELDIQETHDRFGKPKDYGILDDNERVLHVLNAGNSNFIITNTQFVITRDNDLVGRCLLSDINNVELEIRKGSIGIAIILIILGISAIVLMRSIWLIGILFILSGGLTYFSKVKILKIKTPHSKEEKMYTINADEEKIRHFIMILRKGARACA